jgi:hypothetical protein
MTRISDLSPMRQRRLRQQLARMIPQGVGDAGGHVVHKHTPASVSLIDRLWPMLEALLLGRHRVCRWVMWGVVALCAAVVVRVWVSVATAQ